MQTEPGENPAIDWSKVPANPGHAFLLHLRPDPASPEGPPVRGWQRRVHGVMYRARDGRLVTYHHPDAEAAGVQLAAFHVAARRDDLRLVGRAERRQMWSEERKRYKRIQAKRRATERSENVEL